MLRTQRKAIATKARAVSLVFFSVGGQRLGARAEEVGGIWPCPDTLSVPSKTPYVNGLVRQGNSVLPVFDLAGKLGTQIQGAHPLCLIAKCEAGPMAVCIDEAIPTIQVMEPDALRAVPDGAAGGVSICRVGPEDVPIYSLVRLTGGSESPESGGQGL